MGGKLTEEEKVIAESYENEEWVSADSREEIEKYKAAARNTFKKERSGEPYSTNSCENV